MWKLGLTEVALFPEKEYINGIAVAVLYNYANDLAVSPAIHLAVGKGTKQLFTADLHA
jgi:hypothetical protein